jgi:hypothetical protein
MIPATDHLGRLVASWALLAALCWLPANSAAAQNEQTPTEEASSSNVAAAAGDDSSERFRSFAELLSNRVLVGRFTVDGSEGELKEERYELGSVTKLPNGDFWLFKTRIRYGDHDVTVPLPLEVKWAGSTPVITVNDVTIPGLGTFSARVVIADGKYTGTWRHDAVGGHLFGQITMPEK